MAWPGTGRWRDCVRGDLWRRACLRRSPVSRQTLAPNSVRFLDAQTCPGLRGRASYRSLLGRLHKPPAHDRPQMSPKPRTARTDDHQASWRASTEGLKHRLARTLVASKRSAPTSAETTCRQASQVTQSVEITRDRNQMPATLLMLRRYR